MCSIASPASRCGRLRSGRCRSRTCRARRRRRRSRFRPSRRPTITRASRSDNLIDFTPELRAEAVKLLSRYKLGPIFTPPPISKAEGPIAALPLVRAAPTGRAARSIPRPTSSTSRRTRRSVPVGLMPPPSKEFSDLRYVLGNAATGVRYITGPGENAGADAPPARPLAAPPASAGGAEGAGGDGSGARRRRGCRC